MIFYRTVQNAQSYDMASGTNQINQSKPSRRGRKSKYENLSSPERTLKKQEDNAIAAAKYRRNNREERDRLKSLNEQQKLKIANLEIENATLKVF
jgi:hypothetical protein